MAAKYRLYEHVASRIRLQCTILWAIFWLGSVITAPNAASILDRFVFLIVSLFAVSLTFALIMPFGFVSNSPKMSTLTFLTILAACLFLPEIFVNSELPHGSLTNPAVPAEKGATALDIANFVLSCAAWAAILLIGAYALGLARDAYLARLDRKYGVDVAIFRNTVYLAQWLSSAPKRRAEINERVYGAQQLAIIARGFEKSLAKMLHVPSRNSGTVLRERLNEIGASIRSYELEAIAPSESNFADLKRLSEQVIVVLCTGSLAAYSMRKLPATAGGRVRLLSAIHVLRSLFIATLPAGVLGSLKALGYLPSQIAATAFTVAAIWGIVGILSAIDPLISTRIQTTKDLFSVFKSAEEKDSPRN